MVPLFYHPDIDVAKQVLKACYEGGARLMEFTNRGDFALEIFTALNKYAIAELPGMMLGVGSVTDAASASAYMLAGANFVVTPVYREDIAIVCNRRKVLWSPGCGSLTEIAQAEEMGCEVVKLFPGSTLGPGFVKAIKGPQPWTLIMPTGGGKSICFQIPALLQEGVCLVVTPLIALMQDQVGQLRQQGLSAAALHTGMHAKEMDMIDYLFGMS